MTCTKCGSTNVLTEGLGDDKVKATCQQCAYTEIRDSEGRQMLTDDMPGGDRRLRLTEAKAKAQE